MARGGIKKVAKSSQQVKPEFASTTGANTASALTAHAPPAPFKSAPAALLPLAETLPTDHVFLVHVESTPPGMRKQTFLVPIILNLIILSGLCWRLYYAVPTYLEQMITIMGYETRWTVKPKALAWHDLGEILFYRTFLLSMDYVIFGLLGRWPYEFLFGDKHGRYVGPCSWKWTVGFSRKQEPIVRRGRKWDSPIYAKPAERKKLNKAEKSWTQEEELTIHTKCSDALSTAATTKNALTLLDKDWDLDYAGMVDATELLDASQISIMDLDRVVLVPWQGKWYSWYPHASQAPTDRPVGAKDEKLENFRKHLSELNCDDIFYRWIELIQYETSQPGGFTAERRKSAEAELRKMLKSKQKDDEAFITSVGGLTSIPGLA